MRSLTTAALLAMMVAGGLWSGQAQAQAQQAELHVLTPAVTRFAGLEDLAKAYTAKTGVKVSVKTIGMSRVVNEAQKGTPVTDVVALPIAFMDGMEAEGAVVPGSRAELGRVYIGLAVRKGQPRPDISTPAKFAAALKAGGTVMYSNPATGSMEANIINNMLHQHAIFKGVKSKIGVNTRGADALAKGQGDMALQLICEILNRPQLELVGIVPKELNAYIDIALAVPKRSEHQAEAKAFIAYLLSPDNAALWKSKGLEREN